MKKLLAVLMPLTLALTACATGTTGTGTSATPTTGNLAMMAVKVGVQAKCITELNNNSYWKTNSYFLCLS